MAPDPNDHPELLAGTPLREVAVASREMYKEMREAGFSMTEALIITAHMIAALSQMPTPED